jgi:anti-sigma regulatory factor (Ser/Thr protein kinase)
MEVLRLPFDHHSDSAALRHAAQHRLSGWQTADQVDDTLLVITELMQNVIQHTGDGGELALTRHPDRVLVEVSDSSTDEPRVYQPDPRRVGGRGMLVVSAMSRTWGSRRRTGGKIVWAEMPARADGQRTSDTRPSSRS